MNIVIVFAVSAAFVVTGVSSAYQNFNCPTQGNSSVLLGCVTDCQQQHGANTGLCGDASAGDYHCYCDGRTGRVMQRSQLQCKEMNDGFRNVCSIDCICNHAALGGHCAWDLGVCYCESQGSNPKNIGCPANTATEWRTIARDLAMQK